MLNILADMFTAATRQNSNMSPLGEDERRHLSLEQSRRERRIAEHKANARFYRQG